MYEYLFHPTIYVCVCVYIYIYIFIFILRWEKYSPQWIVNNFLIIAQIPLKICVWYLDPMGISIQIRFYNNLPPKNVKKNTFSRVEISIRQYWKFVFNNKIVQNSIVTFIPFQF